MMFWYGGGAARRILDQRLSGGEIDAEEYRRLRDLIDDKAGRSAAGNGGAR